MERYGLHCIAEALQRNSTLTHVSLSHCGIDDDQFNYILYCLKKRSSHAVLRLTLCYNKITGNSTSLCWLTSDR